MPAPLSASLSTPLSASLTASLSASFVSASINEFWSSKRDADLLSSRAENDVGETELTPDRRPRQPLKRGKK